MLFCVRSVKSSRQKLSLLFSRSPSELFQILHILQNSDSRPEDIKSNTSPSFPKNTLTNKGSETMRERLKFHKEGFIL